MKPWSGTDLRQIHLKSWSFYCLHTNNYKLWSDLVAHIYLLITLINERQILQSVKHNWPQAAVRSNLQTMNKIASFTLHIMSKLFQKIKTKTGMVLFRSSARSLWRKCRLKFYQTVYEGINAIKIRLYFSTCESS